MKRSKLKALAIVTIVMMIMSLFTVMAFAGEQGSDPVGIGTFTKGTIKINSMNAGDQFDIYKIVDITYSQTSNTVEYAFTVGAAAYAATLTPAMSISTYKALANDSEALNDFVGGYAAYVRANTGTIAVDKTATAVAVAGGNLATINDVALGQYLVLGVGNATGTAVYQPMMASFVPNETLNVNTVVTLSAKKTTPSIVKKIKKDGVNVDAKDVAVGEEVTFDLTMGVPTYPAGATNKEYTVVDTLPTGLTYVEGSASKTPTSVVGQVITWEYAPDELVGSTLNITYKATVTDDINATHTAVNTAELTYAKNPYGEGTTSIQDTAIVYTYGLEITKVDASDNNIKLQGVQFEVHKETKGGELVGIITTDGSGIAKIDGLALGKYVLVETKAATGYLLPPELVNGVAIELKDDDLDGNIDGAESAVKAQLVTNSKGAFNLPTTGGIGTWVFTMAGIALLGLAIIFMLIVKRRQQTRA